MMKLGFKQIVINPEFPVNRMLFHKGEKHQEVSDDLHCRMLRNVSLGQCLHTGKTITSFTLRHRKSTSGCTPDRRLSRIFPEGWIRPVFYTARDRFRSHIPMIFRWS